MYMYSLCCVIHLARQLILAGGNSDWGAPTVVSCMQSPHLSVSLILDASDRDLLPPHLLSLSPSSSAQLPNEEEDTSYMCSTGSTTSDTILGHSRHPRPYRLPLHCVCVGDQGSSNTQPKQKLRVDQTGVNNALEVIILQRRHIYT